MNHYDAFSHSQQCDGFFSVISVIPGGVKHDKCLCWCHNTEYLFSSPEPEYDFSPPPEYLSSADRAFILDEPAHVRVGYNQVADAVLTFTGSPLNKDATLIDRNLSGSFDPAMSRSRLYAPANVTEPERLPLGVDIFTGPANKAGFTNWSRQELRSGKCETCGDTLMDCECVE